MTSDFVKAYADDMCGIVRIILFKDIITKLLSRTFSWNFVWLR